MLSYTGGAALDHLKTQLGRQAGRTFVWQRLFLLVHDPVPPVPAFYAHFPYFLGTYSDDLTGNIGQTFHPAGPAIAKPKIPNGGGALSRGLSVAGECLVQRTRGAARPSSVFLFFAIDTERNSWPMARMGYCPSG